MLLIFYLWFYLVVGLKTHGLAMAGPLGFHSKEYWLSDTEANMCTYTKGINARIYGSEHACIYRRKNAHIQKRDSVYVHLASVNAHIRKLSFWLP